MTMDLITDVITLLGRSLRHVMRSPDTIITTAITPIVMLLLFVFVFGGAIDTGRVSYVNYLLPGILLITVASGVAYTALRLYTDVSSGIFERFQSMPIARSAVLWGHVVTSVITNLISLALVVLVAVAIGFRSGAGVGAWLGVLGIVVLFTLALTWLAVSAGLLARSPDGAGAFAIPCYSFRSSARPSCPPRACPARCGGSPNTSRSLLSLTRSATCTPTSRRATTCGPPSPGALAWPWWPTPSACTPIAGSWPEPADPMTGCLPC